MIGTVCSLGTLGTLSRLAVTVSAPLFPVAFFLELDSVVRVSVAPLITHSLASVYLLPERCGCFSHGKNLRIFWVCSTQVLLLHKKPAYREAVFVDNPLVHVDQRLYCECGSMLVVRFIVRGVIYPQRRSVCVNIPT